MLLIQSKLREMLTGAAQRWLRFFEQQMIAHHEGINVRKHKTAIGIIRRAHNRFAANVETGIDDDGAARTPVKLVHHRVEQSMTLSINSLNSRTVIHMRNRGDHAALNIQSIDPPQRFVVRRNRQAFILLNRGHELHVWTLAAQIEPFRNMLAKHTRRKRSKAFAKLDLEVHLRLHLRITRVSDDAARAQSAWSKLHPATKPTNHFPGCEQRRHFSRERKIGQSLRDARHTLDIGADLSVSVFRPEEGSTHRVAAVIVARTSHHLVPDGQRGAERSTGISRRRLYPDPLERTFAQDATVRNAVERDTSGQAKICLAGFFMCAPRHSQHRFFSHDLNAGREIHVFLRELSLGLARWSTEELVETLARHRQTRAVVEIFRVQPERSVFTEIE